MNYLTRRTILRKACFLQSLEQQILKIGYSNGSGSNFGQVNFNYFVKFGRVMSCTVCE